MGVQTVGRGRRNRLRPGLILGVRWSGLLLLGVVALTGCNDGLPDKGTVVGTVVDARDQPRPHCSVTRTVQGSNPYPFTEEAAGTDDDGEFTWEMYPGAYLLTVICPGDGRELRGISAPVDVSSGRDTPVSMTVN